MTAITLAQADRLIDAILARGAELDCRPLAVIVVEPGCKVKAFKKEDGSSMIRFEMAYGKAYAALAMGRSSKLVKVRAEQRQAASRFFPRAAGCRFAMARARSSARSASPAIRRSATRSSPPTASAPSGSKPTRTARRPWAAGAASG